jgi:hypothetical protein
MAKRLGVPTDPEKITKLAALQRVSPFCYGFLRYELTKGITPDELQEAIVKSASLDGSIASVWNDFFEKTGAGIFSAPGTSVVANPVPTLKPPITPPTPAPHPVVPPKPQIPQNDPGTEADLRREVANRPLPAYTPKPQSPQQNLLTRFNPWGTPQERSVWAAANKGTQLGDLTKMGPEELVKDPYYLQRTTGSAFSQAWKSANPQQQLAWASNLSPVQKAALANQYRDYNLSGMRGWENDLYNTIGRSSPLLPFMQQYQHYTGDTNKSYEYGRDAIGQWMHDAKGFGLAPLWERWNTFTPAQRQQLSHDMPYQQLDTLGNIFNRQNQASPPEITNELQARAEQAKKLQSQYGLYQQLIKDPNSVTYARKLPNGQIVQGRTWNSLPNEQGWVNAVTGEKLPYNPLFAQADRGRTAYIQNMRRQVLDNLSRPEVKSNLQQTLNLGNMNHDQWNNWIQERYPELFPDQQGERGITGAINQIRGVDTGPAWDRHAIQTIFNPDGTIGYKLTPTQSAISKMDEMQRGNPDFVNLATAIGVQHPASPVSNWAPEHQESMLRLLSNRNLWNMPTVAYPSPDNPSPIVQPTRLQQGFNAFNDLNRSLLAASLMSPAGLFTNMALGTGARAAATPAAEIAAARTLPGLAAETMPAATEAAGTGAAPGIAGEVAAATPKAYNPALGMAQGLGAEAAPAVAPAAAPAAAGAAEAATGTATTQAATEAAASKPWWRTLLDPYKAPTAPKLTGIDKWLPSAKVPYTPMAGTRPTNLSSYGLEQVVQNTLERTGMRNVFARPIMGALRSATIPWRVASGEGAFVNALRGNTGKAMGYGTSQAMLPLVASKVGDPREAQQANPANVMTSQGFPGISVPAGVIGSIGEAVDPGTGWMPKGTPTIAHYTANNLRNVGVIGRWLKDLPSNIFAQKNVSQFAEMIPKEAPGSIKGFTQGQMGGSPSREAGEAIAEINRANQIIEDPNSTPAAKQNSIEQREIWKAKLAPLQSQYAGRWGNDITNLVPTMFAIDNLKALQQKLTAQGAPKEQLDRVNTQLAAQQGRLSNYQISDIEQQRLRNYQDQVREALRVVGAKPLTPEEQAGNFGQPVTAAQGLTAPLTTAASLIGSAGSAMSRLYGTQTGPETAEQEAALRRAALHAFQRFGFKDPRTGIMAHTFLGFDPQGQPITDQQQLLHGTAGQVPVQPATSVPASATPGAPAAPAPTRPAGTVPAAPATAQQKTPPPSQVQQGLATRIQQMPEGEQKQRAQALYQWTHEAGNAGLQKAKGLGYDNLEDTNQWNRFVNDPTVRQEAAKNLTNDPTFQQKFPNMDPEKALGVSLGIWDRMNDTQKWFLFGGLGIAALGLLTSMFSSDDDEEDGGGGIGLFGPALGLGGLAAAGYGISGGHPSRLLNPAFYRSQTTVS